MTFPFPHFSPKSSAVALPVVNYIGNRNNAGASPYTYSAPLGAVQAGRIVVVIATSTGIGVPTHSGLTVGGVAWTAGNSVTSGSVTGSRTSLFYGVDAVNTVANVTLTAAGEIANQLQVWTIYGCSSTPLDQVSVTLATGATLSLNDIQAAINGALIAGCTADRGGGNVTFSGVWNGTDTLVEDSDTATADGNQNTAEYHIATMQATTLNDLIITISASRAHSGLAISFGP